ncbi:class I SAM-dependent methyltransferase [Streptomyces orinoci]|uniref:Class I SAM-dependent methyltransferase n=1 Tax=Streptomyces orinoci TaxID=67339 RepID=A0ABV3K3Y6_STRON|nr:class I SAM-dependent methyltransferase [Streptomyces orinoci]
MTLELLREHLVAGERAAGLAAAAASPEERFYLAMAAYRAGDPETAAGLAAEAAAAEPGRVVYTETARWLAAGRQPDVYGESAAFSAFVGGGGNVELYRATREALRGEYTARRPRRLLDIGSGEGHALLPALTEDVGFVEVVEPSAERLELVTGELARRGIPHRGHALTGQEFMARAADGSWDLVQETFALLTLGRAERLELLRWLRPRTRRLVLVEFDAPVIGDGLEPRWFRYLVSRYERGLREYGDSRELVAQGFLIPVLLGKLGSSGHQEHDEQPVAAWVADLAEAGFTPEEPRRLCDYWWAPVHAVTAGT